MLLLFILVMSLCSIDSHVHSQFKVCMYSFFSVLVKEVVKAFLPRGSVSVTLSFNKVLVYVPQSCSWYQCMFKTHLPKDIALQLLSSVFPLLPCLTELLLCTCKNHGSFWNQLLLYMYITVVTILTVALENMLT